MQHQPQNPQSISTAQWRRAGFSFVEVMFAVMLLGIGFIMIAGIFPVAIQQTQLAANETEGALVARDAIRQIQTVANQVGASADYFPVPASDPVIPFGLMGVGPQTSLTQAIGTNGFFTSDRRFAWVGFYKRANATDPFVQVFITVLQNPDFQNPSAVWYGYPPIIPSFNYVPDTTANPGGKPILPVYNSPIRACLAYSPSTATSYVYLYNTNYTTASATPQPPDPVANAATGSYLLISQDDPGWTSPNPPPARPAHALTGRFFKLGQQIATAVAANSAAPPTNLPSDVVPPFSVMATSVTVNTTPLDIYQLEPGYDLKDESEITEIGANGLFLNSYIIGRSLQSYPTTGKANQANFNGPNQDIAALSATIRINTANN